MNIFKKATRKLKNIFFLIYGFILYFLLGLKNKSLYLGEREFFRISQDDKNSFAKKSIITLLEFHAGYVYNNYRLWKENKDRERGSSIIGECYSDDSLSGYGDVDYTRSGVDNLEQQQRGLILPFMDKALSKTRGKVIVEIGTGNGDILAYLRQKYPDNIYVGVDFSVKNAQIKYGNIKNISFIKGYAFELLEQGKIKGDIVFGSSTFCLFLPKELKSYFSLFKTNGFKQIILNEPTWGGYHQENNGVIISKHIEGGCWYHNWCGYLRQATYEISDFSHFHYKHPTSPRPDIYISLIIAKSIDS